MATATRTHSRATRHVAHLQRLAAGSRAADADEQSRSGRRRASRRLVVYGGSGKSGAQLAGVRRHRAHADLARARRNTARPVRQARRRFSDPPGAPRVLIANAMLVPAWANWETFRDLEDRGLTMYGQMTAGSWIYIGTRESCRAPTKPWPRSRAGISAARSRQARRHRRPRRHGWRAAAGRHDERGRRPWWSRWIRRASRAGWRRDTRRSDRRWTTRWTRARCTRAASARSIGLRGNAADVLPALVARGVTPDVLTDQTSAHDALNGYVPERHVARRGDPPARARPRRIHRRVDGGDGRARAAMLELQERGAVTFDYGNNIRAQAQQAGVGERVRHSRIRPRVHPAAVLRRQGTVPVGRALRRSGRHSRTDEAALEMFADDEALCRWIRLAGERVAFQGCRRGSAGSATASARDSGCGSTTGPQGRVKAPIVIGRDHLDAGSVASPNRETEGMRDGSDAIADWPVLNALLNTSAARPGCRSTTAAASASATLSMPAWSSSRTATSEADEKLEVLTYDRGSACAARRRRLPGGDWTAQREGLRIPMREEGE